MIYSEIKDDFNTFLRNYGIWIAVAVVALIAITIILILYFNKKNKDKKGKIKDTTASSDWLIALGGKENIIESSANGSRLSLKLNDQNKIDKEKLKELGVSNIVTMSNKVTLVLEDKAEIIKSKLD